MMTGKKQDRYQLDFWSIGNNIRRVREERGISKFDLANELGLSDDRSVYYYENGEKLTLQRIAQISKVLGVSVDSLLVYN
jgi:transcriptional regulator with XRE-family HTH domain